MDNSAATSNKDAASSNNPGSRNICAMLDARKLPRMPPSVPPKPIKDRRWSRILLMLTRKEARVVGEFFHNAAQDFLVRVALTQRQLAEAFSHGHGTFSDVLSFFLSCHVGQSLGRLMVLDRLGLKGIIHFVGPKRDDGAAQSGGRSYEIATGLGNDADSGVYGEDFVNHGSLLAGDESEEEPKDFYAWYRDYRAQEFSRLYKDNVERVPPIRALVQEFVPPAWVEDILKRIGAAETHPTNASEICREFLGPPNNANTRVIAVVALEKLVSCLERSFRFAPKDDEERVLDQQDTEAILRTMTHHAQFKTIQSLGCKLLSRFCHRQTVESQEGAQVMMDIVSNFPEDEQLQQVVWKDLIDRSYRLFDPNPHPFAFVQKIAERNAFPLGCAVLDRFTQNWQICLAVLRAMRNIHWWNRDTFFALAREQPNLNVLLQRVQETPYDAIVRETVHDMALTLATMEQP